MNLRKVLNARIFKFLPKQKRYSFFRQFRANRNFRVYAGFSFNSLTKGFIWVDTSMVLSFP